MESLRNEYLKKTQKKLPPGLLAGQKGRHGKEEGEMNVEGILIPSYLYQYFGAVRNDFCNYFRSFCRTTDNRCRC